MSGWKYNFQVRQAICLVLVFAIFLQFMVQLQAHVHHVEDANVVTEDDHVIDYHLIIDKHAHEPSSSDEIHELKTTPDIILKKSLDRDLSFLFAILFILVVSIAQVRCKPIWDFSKHILIHNVYYGLAPPTRAPPVN